MQPMYLPWLGYFDLIDQSDVFVFLDTVQFQKQSWQQRNKIRTPKGLEWITVPVLIQERFGQLIKDVEIFPGKFPEKHIKQVKQNYSRAPYFNSYYDEFAELLRSMSGNVSLCDINIQLIQWLCRKLAMPTRFIRASELGVGGQKTELLINILKAIGATRYLSPLGSISYLKNDGHWFSENNISLAFHNYSHAEYNQVYAPFMAFASIIDLLFNEGDNGMNVIRSGRRDDIHPSALIA